MQELLLVQNALFPQVCDKLSDDTTGDWAEVLAERLNCTRWEHHSQSHEIQRVVLSLTPNLQELVLRQLGDITARVICHWPCAMQHVRTSLQPVPHING